MIKHILKKKKLRKLTKGGPQRRPFKGLEQARRLEQAQNSEQKQTTRQQQTTRQARNSEQKQITIDKNRPLDKAQTTRHARKVMKLADIDVLVTFIKVWGSESTG